MNEEISLRIVSPQEAREHVGALAAILIDCVHGGASVGFMAPLSRERAEAFWQGVAEGVAAGERILLIAQDRSTGQIVGTVQVVLKQPDNQQHRAEIAKMQVHRQARRRGIGEALMRAAEEAARKAGRSVLVLDTVTGSDGERLYERVGWTRAGIIPNYALWPTGGFCDASLFYKQIAEA